MADTATKTVFIRSKFSYLQQLFVMSPTAKMSEDHIASGPAGRAFVRSFGAFSFQQ